MKNFLLLIFALLIVVVFGGAAFFFWDVSKGASFERLDQPAETAGSTGIGSSGKTEPK